MPFTIATYAKAASRAAGIVPRAQSVPDHRAPIRESRDDGLIIVLCLMAATVVGVIATVVLLILGL